MRGRVAEWLRTEWQSVHGPPAAREFSLEAPIVLVSAVAILALMHFHGTAAELGPILSALQSSPLAAPASALHHGRWYELASYAFWAGAASRDT